MLERLVESWLDSQGERQYQAALVQALISDGWTILHNSRHSPIEYGRDVILRDRSGNLFALQLKGNPGTRLTKRQLQELLPQLRELIIVPLGDTYYKSAKEKATAVLVTNGVVDEEAEREIDLLRQLLPGSRTSHLEVWSRGQLLDLFIRHARRVWPTSLEGVRSLLELHSQSGDGPPDPILVAKICEDSLRDAIASKSKKAKLAAIYQLAVLIEIMKGPWRARENYWGAYLIGVIGYAYALQLAGTTSDTEKAFSRVSASIWDDGRDLIQECMRKRYEPDKVWFEYDPFAEYVLMHQRRQEIATVCATVLLSGIDLVPEERRFAVRVLEANLKGFDLWGEAQVPALVVQYIALGRYQGGDWIDDRMAGLVLAIALRQHSKDKSKHLPSPYYKFEDAFFHSNGIRWAKGAGLSRDGFSDRSSMCWPVFLLLSKRNRKRTCRTLWPAVSKLVHESLTGVGLAFFSPSLARVGHHRTRTLYSMGWHELVSEACRLPDTPELEGLDLWAPLVAAYVAAVPYRASPDVLLLLDAWMSKTWYTADYLPPR